ncbi:hypothetical protein BDV09DRAFT_191451 [Aspergillus tetrazonus]
MRIDWLHRNAHPLKAQKIQQTVKPAIANKHNLLGANGSGQKAKYAVNLYLIAMTAGLAESMTLARAQGLDIEAFGKFLMPFR